MHPVRASVRVFVYATEDEDRVRDALLRLIGAAGTPQATSRVTRGRTKGHHGGEILLLEAVAKKPAELRELFDQLEDVRETLQGEFQARLDEDRVLHFRLDKQHAMADEWRLAAGGDTIELQVKYGGYVKGEPQGFPFQ